MSNTKIPVARKAPYNHSVQASTSSHRHVTTAAAAACLLQVLAPTCRYAMLWVVSSMRWSTSLTLLLVAWMAVTSAASSASGDLGRSGDSGRCGLLPLAGTSMRMERSRLGGSLVPGGSRLCAGQVGGWTQTGSMG